ncbi:MAG: hypothetical protein WC859_06490 [Elusimicrobiota bacterium]|jgi:hypothetical protein
MSDDENKFEIPSEEPSEQKPFPIIPVIIGIVLFGLVVAWIAHEKAATRAKEAAIAVLDKELTVDEASVQAQREKVVQITQQLEAIKMQLQTNQAKDRKKAIDDYNALAKQQNTEREKAVSMATDYNAKVAKSRELAE